MRKQDEDDKRRWAGVELAPASESETITEGPYKGFKVSQGDLKPDPARRDECFRQAEEWRSKRKGERS